MSEDDTQTRAEADARATEIRENVAMSDARRAEEQVARAQAEKEAAAKKEEKLSRKERRLRDEAERAHAEADRQRAEATAQTVSGARVASPGVGSTSDPNAAAAASSGGFPGSDRLPEAAQRPEVLVGATFAGAFILARILKRIFD